MNPNGDKLAEPDFHNEISDLSAKIRVLQSRMKKALVLLDRAEFKLKTVSPATAEEIRKALCGVAS